MEESNIKLGLDKLDQAAADVEVLKAELATKGVTLREATEETDKLLKKLDVENQKADKKSKEVNATTEACTAQRNEIEIQKSEAEVQLAAALPYLHKAEKAVDSI